MKTAYFSFGQIHVHRINGVTFDADCLVKITADDPRSKMVEIFGQKWGMEYSDPPEERFYPRGIFEL